MHRRKNIASNALSAR